MIVEFFKAAEQDKPGTCYTKGFDRKFYPTEDVLLVIEHEGKIRILDFHGSRPNSAGYARTLYGNFSWPIDFPTIDIGKKTPMNVLDNHIYFNQSDRNAKIQMINKKYGNRMFGYNEPIELNKPKDLHVPSFTLPPIDNGHIEYNMHCSNGSNIKCTEKGEEIKPFEYEIDKIAKDQDFNPKYSNDHQIGIVLGGYLDSNHRLIDRPELNRRIVAKDKEIEELRKVVLNMNDEGAKQSARDIWYTKFHDIVKDEYLTPLQYRKITEFMFSENDR